eukprot:766151-Pelagomonas_calceolata.AAC.1
MEPQIGEPNPPVSAPRSPPPLEPSDCLLARGCDVLACGVLLIGAGLCPGFPTPRPTPNCIFGRTLGPPDEGGRGEGCVGLSEGEGPSRAPKLRPFILGGGAADAAPVGFLEDEGPSTSKPPELRPFIFPGARWAAWAPPVYRGCTAWTKRIDRFVSG